MADSVAPAAAPVVYVGGIQQQVQTMPFNPNLNSNVVQTVQPQQVASVVASPDMQTQQGTAEQNRFIQV